MTLETWLAFAAASLIAVMIPGPVVVFILGRSLGGGWRAALPTVGGVALGDAVALTASLAGLGALLAASAAAFTVAKWLGAAYLIWLGVKLWRAPVGETSGEAVALPARHAFRDAFLVTVLNPKSIAFFVAFVPQFLNPERAFLPQAALVLVTFVGLGALNALGYALLAGTLSDAVKRPAIRRGFNRLGGGMLIGAGLATAAMRRA
ncbi:LysE family translocator [Roseococcus sp. SDR]|uniref:LysE family translocator n=1 Tax=Roseococcus sp. SDR TaxID=2835532 RepID=UPI001BCD7091|nr:LysE family translocator [Roseococcus sp. SDR]MBS7792828.1 LysE family translocator [Roseococcus sp. SDR]MBV1848142.1 LysE family translocator [Roseococcus sp. SDR]